MDDPQQLYMFEWLAKRLNDMDQLHLLDRFLLVNARPSPITFQLLQTRAALLKRRGDLVEAIETLLRIPPEQRDDEAIVLLIECAAVGQRLLDYAALLEQIQDWEQGPRVQRLIRALAALPEEMILSLIRHLCQLAPRYGYLVWQEVAPILRHPAQRLQLIHLLGEGDGRYGAYLELPPNEIYHYLAREVKAHRLPDTYLDALIEAGLLSPGPSGIAGFFAEWARRHLSRGSAESVQAIQQRFEQALPWLSTAQQESITTQLMDALQRVGLGENAVWLACSRVEDALRESNFERAEVWLREARNRISTMPPNNRSSMLGLIKQLDEHLQQARHAFTSSFAPRYGSDPGLAPILKLYGIEAIDAFWADLAEVLEENEYVVRQLVERLEQLQQVAQQSGSGTTTIHSLSQLARNVSRMELTDSARLIFKKVGKTIRLIALYANHDAYDEALKQRWELLNRLR
ncbi:MAG: hypothetical protein H0T73_17440 [Ardenticatenales bacterium]|nr:hypothetical protein [Ardenticatenales bacterium]